MSSYDLYHDLVLTWVHWNSSVREPREHFISFILKRISGKGACDVTLVCGDSGLFPKCV